MSAHTHLNEERLSLQLDGMGSPEDVAHVTGCERCASRLDALRDAVRLVAASVAPPPSAQRDAAVWRALEMASAPVRRHRRRRSRIHLSERVRGLAATATVVVLLAGGVAAIVTTAHGGSSTKSSTASAPATSAGAHGAVSRPGPSSPSAFDGPETASPPGLGSFESVAAVLAELRASLAAPGSASDAGPLNSAESPAQCSAVADSVGGSTTVAYRSILTYKGAPAYVFVFNRSDGRVAVIVAAAGCRLIASATF